MTRPELATKILIIEDNDMLNKSYEMMLSFHGYQVTTAFNGAEGLEIIRELKPDIVLLDYLMPVMDGREFLVAYNPVQHSHTKIVLLTNLDDQDKISEAYKLGIDSYLLKSSIYPDQLVSHVKSLERKT